MPHTFGNNETLSRSEIHSATFEVDEKTSIKNEKEFIDVVVLVPVILTLDHGHPDHRIIHLAERLVVPFVSAGVRKLLHIDELKRAMQNVEVSLVRKFLNRFSRVGSFFPFEIVGFLTFDHYAVRS
jgi:hypothetical protein